MKSGFSARTVILFSLYISCGSFHKMPTARDFDTDKQNLSNGKLETNRDILKGDNFELPGTDSSTHKTSPRKEADSPYVLEGGDTLSPSAFSQDQDTVKLTHIDEQTHTKGSKGRKGVSLPVVVARKGVEPDEVEKLQSTKSVLTAAVNQSSPETSEKPIIPSVIQHYNSSLKLPINETVHHNESDKKVMHKKPEFLSDEGDVDDFSQYPIIKTSTTGEDYVIIGIVIIIGIWFSVFGALIFYRRAGEYWDRRHYRRMDFLVEGMYND